MNQKTERPENGDEELLVQDDEIIGTAFKRSLVFIVLIVAALGLVIFLRGKQPAPEAVVEAQAVAPSRLDTQASRQPPVVRFSDVTAESGIGFVHHSGAYGERLLPETMGGGVAVFDFDNDGDMDLFFVNSTDWPWHPDKGPARSALYLNDGSGHFTDAGDSSGVPADIYGMGVATGDYDNDGWVDLLVTTLGANRLLRNVDGKRFVDVTSEAGVAGDDSTWSTSAVFFDADNDGDLDLFVANYVEWSRDIDLEVDYQLTGIGRAFGPPANYAGTQNYFYLNNGDGSFSDRSEWVEVFNPATGNAMGKGLAVIAIDVNDDGWTDLIVANDTVQNFVYLNQAGQGFADTGAGLGMAFDNSGHATGAMGIDAANYTNDDDMAVAIGNFSNEMTSFYVAQDGGSLFSDQAIQTGIGPASRLALSFGLFFFDYDLDGRIDLLQTNGHVEPEINVVQPSQHYRQASQLFWNCGLDCPRIFEPVAGDSAGDLSQPIVGRGASYGDLDGDGDLDIVLTQIDDRPVILRNDQALGHHWLRLRLSPAPDGRSPWGALVTLTTRDGKQQRLLSPSRSYLSQVEPVLTFGLGDLTDIDRLDIQWPDGKNSTLDVDRVDREMAVDWPE